MPSVAGLESYAARHRPNELILIAPDDQFVSASLPLPHIRYVLYDARPTRPKLPLDFEELGITVTIDQFVDLDRWRGQFEQRLAAWGLPSGEPIATVVLARSPDDVRRIARQTSRAVGEQETALSALASGAVRQSATVAASARAAQEQAAAGDEIARVVTEMRGQAKEIASALAQHAKTMTANAADVASVASQVGKIRLANVQHADALALITSALGEGAPMHQLAGGLPHLLAGGLAHQPAGGDAQGPNGRTETA